MNLTLQLMTGQDIPIPECGLILHQPTIKEISLISEQTFFTGAQCLCINKNMYLGTEASLDNITNFQLIISLLNEKDKKIMYQKNCALQVLQLLFPEYKIIVTPRTIMFNLNTQNIIVDESNFNSFQMVCKQVFCLGKTDKEVFNPANAAAKKIADKIMQGRQRVAELKAAENGENSIFAQYLSILTVGLSSMSLNDLINLTMFQLYDLVERYQLYIAWDLDIRAKMAGSTNEKESENWMKSIH